MVNVDQYFDVVYCKRDGVPMFHGTPEEVKAWLRKKESDPLFECAHVCLGSTSTYTSIENYIAN